MFRLINGLKFDNGFIVLACLIFIYSYNAYIYPWMMDDAFIFFRYAENFARGEGFVYNPGEKVEGCTSFLWLMVLSFAALFKIDLLLFSKILNAVLIFWIIGFIASSHKFIRIFTSGHSAAAAAMLAVSPAFAPWLSSGMESVFFSFLIIITFFYSTGLNTPVEYAAAGVLCALTLICRPEGIFLIMPLLVYNYYNISGGCRYGLYIFLFNFSALYSLYFIWRWYYYSSFAPNTYYAKFGFSAAQIVRGLLYVYDYFLAAFFFMCLLVPAGYYLYYSIKFMNRENFYKSEMQIAVLYSFIIGNLFFIIAAGGDFMYAFRFFVHLSAPFSIVAVYVISKLFSRVSVYFKTSVIIIIVYSLLQFFIHGEIYGIIDSSPVLFGRAAGLFLKENYGPKSVLAINTAGIIPYYSGLKTIDMLGLTDSHIARLEISDFGKGSAGHEKGDGLYILERKPELIVMGNFEGSKIPIYRSDRQLFTNGEFKEKYTLKVHKINVAERYAIRERYFYYYVKKGI